MEEEPSKLWRLALVVSLLLLAAVLYYRFEPVREVVDAKCPWVKEQLAQRGILFGAPKESASTPVPSSPGAAATPKPLTYSQIAADRSLWPKTLRIKNATDFPAVSNGKEIGTVNLPAGTEVKLVWINADRVALSFSTDGKTPTSGGVWLMAADTDLLERVRSSHK